MIVTYFIILGFFSLLISIGVCICVKKSQTRAVTSEGGPTEQPLLREEKNSRNQKFDTVKGSKPHKKTQNKGTTVCLEVITGPSVGQSTVNTAERAPWPTVTIGRSSNSSLHLLDSEISSRHAEVTWNLIMKSWQLTDKGSLNGTFINSRPIGTESSSGARKDGKPVNLSDGDVISAGSATKILVKISNSSALDDSSTAVIPSADPPAPETLPSPGFKLSAPFAVGMEADPLFSRKGGKPNPMEDVFLCEWPLRGHEDIGIFCIFDGHAGRAAAENSSRILPEKLSAILKEEEVLEQFKEESTAEKALREAFRETEASLPNEDEGCTATVLLVWKDSFGMYVAQAANVGDSHCVLGFGGQHLVLTEDHRLSGPVERQRLESIGKPLREGETRLCGMNIARVLGDKFLKSQDIGLSAEPYISQAVPLGDGYDTVAVLASDGLWDVISPKRAIQLLLEAKEAVKKQEIQVEEKDPAKAAAFHLVSRAKLAKTHDNTTVVAIDFGAKLC